VDSISTRPSAGDPAGQPPTLRADLTIYRLVLAVLWTLAIMTVCWLPRHVVREIEDDSSWFKIPNFDKLVHCAIFVVFSILWARVWSARRQFAWVILAGLGLAVVTEVVQELPVVGRDASLYDALTDIVGVLIGIAAAPLVEPWARFLELRLFRRKCSQPILAPGATVTVDGSSPPTSRSEDGGRR
jgi:VanZ family protein